MRADIQAAEEDGGDGVSKCRGIHAPRITEQQVEQIRCRYPHEKTEKIASDLGLPVARIYSKAAWLGLSKTSEYLASPDAQRLRRGDNVGAAYRFPKGHVPANKGVKGISYPGMEATQFKKGQKPHTWTPIGTERLSKEGYLQRKMFDTGCTRRDYVPVHHLVWVAHNGPVPQGHCIIFKDGDKRNITIENLDCITRAENMKRNTIHNLPEELKEVLKLKGALNRRITCHERRKRTQKTPV